MALSADQKEVARRIIATHGGSVEEQKRFSSLNDDAASAEIQAFIEEDDKVVDDTLKNLLIRVKELYAIKGLYKRVTTNA